MVTDEFSGEWLAEWKNDLGGIVESTSDSELKPPEFISAGPDQLPVTAPGELLDALRSIGPVSYLPNPSLWDSLATAIMRVATRDSTARDCIRDLSAAHGRFCDSPIGRQFTVPDPTTVLELGDNDFKAAGITRFQPALKAAATAFLRHHNVWQKLDGAELIDALRGILHVGHWTARAAAADYTGDLSLRPVDQTVQRAATRAVPALAGQHRPKEFERLWTTSWCRTPREQHALVLYILARNESTAAPETAIP